MSRASDKHNQVDAELRKHWKDVDKHETDAQLAKDEASRRAAKEAADRAREEARRRADEL